MWSLGIAIIVGWAGGSWRRVLVSPPLVTVVLAEDHYPVRPLAHTDADVPTHATGRDELLNDWSVSAHARSGVNCTACHQPKFQSVKRIPGFGGARWRT